MCTHVITANGVLKPLYADRIVQFLKIKLETCSATYNLTLEAREENNRVLCNQTAISRLYHSFNWLV